MPSAGFGKGVDADLRRHDEGKHRRPGAILTPMGPCTNPLRGIGAAGELYPAPEPSCR
jgi:hypothetical protein